MASTSEQGHNRNAVNFDNLIIICTSYGATYNPNKAAIKIPAMQAQAITVKNSVAGMNNLVPPYRIAVDARIAAFKPLDKIITRANNALKASDTNKQLEETAQTIIRKLLGRRATPRKTEEEKKAAMDAGIEINEISSSQMSYDNRLDNFDKLIKLLSSIPQYVPNEADLKTTSLIALYNDLKAKNTAVISATTLLSNARISRNAILYKENTGLVDITVDTKTYIKSLYGATSPQYKQVSKLEFKVVKA